jgi:hypothetical protein
MLCPQTLGFIGVGEAVLLAMGEQKHTLALPRSPV